MNGSFVFGVWGYPRREALWGLEVIAPRSGAKRSGVLGLWAPGPSPSIIAETPSTYRSR
jgi:hypothetical protein